MSAAHFLFLLHVTREKSDGDGDPFINFYPPIKCEGRASFLVRRRSQSETGFSDPGKLSFHVDWIGLDSELANAAKMPKVSGQQQRKFAAVVEMRHTWPQTTNGQEL